MAPSTVPGTTNMKLKANQTWLTSSPIDHSFWPFEFKVRPCPEGDDCKKGLLANCPYLHPGEQGRRDPRKYVGGQRYEFGDLESCGSKCYGMDVLPSERFLALMSRGQISGYKLQVPCNNGNDNDIAVARAASLAISKFGHYLLKTTAASTYCGNAKSSGGASRKNKRATLRDNLFDVMSASRRKIVLALLRLFVVLSNWVDWTDWDWLRGWLNNQRWWIKEGRRLLSAVDVSPTAGRWERFMPSAETDPGHGMVELVNLIYDSGASKHVTGNRALLHGYEPLLQPWAINVADGYPLRVVGIGYISDQGFNIPNVYHVEGLKMNLISVRQLDKDHGLFSGFHDGICEVMRRDGEIVGGGFAQDADDLYHLRFLQVPEADEGAVVYGRA